MRNIFLFIGKYIYFLVFVALQIICLVLIVQNSKYHHSMFASTANVITGKINEKYDNSASYFRLKRINDSLVKANEALYNKLRANYSIPDSLTKHVIDTLRINDSTTQYRQYTYYGAKVVSNSVLSQANYLVLSGQNVAHFKKDMGVMDINGNVVGIVTDISGDYVVVMSLMHKDSHISGKLFKTGEVGTVIWGKGQSPNELTFTNIPKSAKLAVGDSVVTSSYSTAFPKGLMIGRIKAIDKESANSNYRILLRSAADFYNLEYVYAIANNQQEAIEKVIKDIKAKEK